LCGIVGIYNIDKNSRVNPELVRSMNKKIIHRGPDAEGYFIDKNVGLANRRLSIIDLKTGNQPIFNEDKSLVIVYNGEIYNFHEIKSLLEKKGHIFQTSSDTETILHAYEEYGPKCLNMFNGMFAFAIMDRAKNELFIARDRLGIKPLYYYIDKKRLLFSSEIKAIIADVDVKRKLDVCAFSDYLMFQNILDDKTFFEGIKKLLPGHFIICSSKGFKIKAYWDVKFSESKKDSAYFEKEYRDRVKNSVTDHLLSDVPLGSYLSGGFDSSTVATFASQDKGLKNKRISTFTGYFDEGSKYSELRAAKDVAKRIGAKSFTTSIKPKDFITNIQEIIYHLDEPTTGTGAFPQYMVSKMVSRHVKVVLTGHGGDELFCGYQVFKSVYYKELMRKNPASAIKMLTGIKFSELAKVMYYMFYPLFVDPAVKYGIFIMFNRKEQKKLFTKSFYSQLNNHDPLNTIEWLLKGKKFTDFERTQYLYLKTYLPTLFILEDKVGMAHSIEARTPICGNSVVDFALSIPTKEKMAGDSLKSVTKRAMKGILPESIYSQPKMGFPTPLAKWFKGPLKKFAYELLLSDKSSKRNIFNMKYIKALLDANSRSITDNLYDYVRANKIFSLITIELWFRTFIDTPEGNNVKQN